MSLLPAPETTRLSVAPMMDWTDVCNKAFINNYL